MSGNTSVSVVRGEPSDEELAALAVVLAGLAGARFNAGAPEPAASCSVWADPMPRLRAGQHPGPGAWRTSALPR